jgi:hypothetical protein
VGLERGALSLVSTTEELLDRKSSGSGLESREYGRRNPSRRPPGTLYPQKLALTSLTSGDRSVGVVRLRIQATEFFYRYRWRQRTGEHVPAAVNTRSNRIVGCVVVCALLNVYAAHKVTRVSAHVRVL